ncbi:MAG: glutamine synthetase [Pseudonocardiales bacterium]|nr:glutamine synthetase [Pseudonocardiales bacterium]MDQ1716255.1 glutamine synthetase [Pseudonocardiales bacterium]MDQ1736479.1 glutamine synthetase [Pseudonocardiales bacterium]MDQ1752525.1 glutamine synthetase [Pseudonocardiales bacterium]
MDRQQEYVLRTLEERQIRFVRLWFTDVLGYLKSVAVAPAELEGAFAEGIGFDGSAIEGFARASESDMLARPDPSTFQILPSDDGQPSDTARMFCDITMPDGSPSWADPRYVLRRTLSKAADRGLTFYTHPEIEFFLLKNRPSDGTEPEPIDNGGYFDMTSHDTAHDFRRSAIDALEAVGISVEFSHHEVAPGQQEIDLRYADALSMADNIMSFRHIIKEVARTKQVHATFMPKPFRHQPGSGMHTHLSLFEGDRNAFHDPSDELFLSATARSFIAGLLRHAREITAVTNQWVNSYKRLFGFASPGQIVEAPTYVCWGHANRSALVRVPMYKPGKANSTRVEVRSLDSACNPYLAFAVMLAAGVKGIEEGYELPPGAEDDVWSLSDTERRALGYDELPHNLADALDAMEASELVAETLGEHVFEFFLRNKRAEWVDYRAEVTPFELRRYLPSL